MTLVGRRQSLAESVPSERAQMTSTHISLAKPNLLVTPKSNNATGGQRTARRHWSAVRPLPHPSPKQRSSLFMCLTGDERVLMRNLGFVHSPYNQVMRWDSYRTNGFSFMCLPCLAVSTRAPKPHTHKRPFQPNNSQSGTKSLKHRLGLTGSDEGHLGSPSSAKPSIRIYHINHDIRSSFKKAQWRRVLLRQDRKRFLKNGRVTNS